MSYVKENFLLKNKTAECLYQTYAKDMPIFDYHCHLPEREILQNKQFEDIYSVWLKGDHYKWRLMRNYGIDEELITGSATNKEKFVTYCKVLETAFGNPLQHWSQVELKEFFNCELEISKANAEAIWEWCNEYIRLNKITPFSLIEGANVRHVYTTNEIFDDLTVFEEIAKQGYKFSVTPAFRADKIMNIEAEQYLDYIAKLEGLTFKINCIQDLERAIEIRLDEFVSHGTRATDIALERVYEVKTQQEADEVFKSVLGGNKVTVSDSEIFKGYMTYYLFKLYSTRNLATELHVGAMRNNNTRMLKKLGLDTGFDSISEDNSIRNMSRLFDRLDGEESLPKTVVFNLNPKMNAEIMTLIGSFQDGTAKGKLQFGPAWWFLDNKVGMERHLLDMTATGHIATFIGMLTDSRSFLSYPRHHYFRRILCSYLGELIESGEMTCDYAVVGEVIRDICYRNAIKYFGMDEKD